MAHAATYFWDKVIGQDEANTALRQALRHGNLGHAYLFVGPQGLGKINAARAIAAELLCPEGGCGTCGICTRLARNTHPDFQILEPEGKSEYLIGQIRELNYNINLAPVEADHKVYVLRSADLLSDAAANAFLKTLEEPPANVTLILLAHTAEPILPTILSRCLIVRFKPLAPKQAEEILRAKTGAGEQEARVALAASGNIITAARTFLDSPKQQEARSTVIAAFRDLGDADDLDVLDLAKLLMRSVAGPVEELRAQQEADMQIRIEMLDPVAIKALEQYNKRRLSAFEEQSVCVILNLCASLLRDCLCVAQGAEAQVVNIDEIELIREVGAPMTPAAIERGFEAVARARRRLSHNVGSQLLIETLLFDMREVRTCPR
jgi:DNA polymerase-3 subunit delta'